MRTRYRILSGKNVWRTRRHSKSKRCKTCKANRRYTQASSEEAAQARAGRSISILTTNWQANNLTLTNISVNAATPILVQAYGPGIPGMQPGPLTIGTPVQLAMRQAVQGTTTPNWMQLGFSASTSNLEVVAVVGGPQDQSGNNAYVIALNAPGGDTGPPPLPAPPAGFFATAAGNRYALPFNWGAASVYVVNLSPQTATPVTALLQSL